MGLHPQSPALPFPDRSGNRRHHRRCVYSHRRLCHCGNLRPDPRHPLPQHYFKILLENRSRQRQDERYGCIPDRRFQYPWLGHGIYPDPSAISDALLGLTSNPIIILLIMNVILLIAGTFMDVTPAILIFTPLFLPVVKTFGMDPVQFGLILVYNPVSEILRRWKYPVCSHQGRAKFPFPRHALYALVLCGNSCRASHGDLYPCGEPGTPCNGRTDLTDIFSSIT